MSNRPRNLWEHFDRLATQLSVQSLLAGGIRDHLTLGQTRERLLAEILKRHLPSKVVFGHGEVVDVLGYVSQPMDLLLYRDDVPVFNLGGGTNQYLVEGLYSVIEVKSNLTGSELRRAIDQLASAKRATRMHNTEAMREYYADSEQMLTKLAKIPNNPTTCIFAFEGMPLEKLYSLMSELPADLVPNCVSILTRGTIQRMGSELEHISPTQQGLMSFVFHLIQAVAEWNQQYSWDWYARAELLPRDVRPVEPA